MTSNFSFLQKEKNFRTFAPLMLQAERAMSISPMLAATQARAALEVTVKWLYRMMGICQPVIYGDNGREYNPKLSDLLKDREFRAEVTDRDVYEQMWAITKIGNKAVHTGQATQAEGMLVLKQLLQVGNWVDYLYGEDDDYVDQRAFDESLVPSPDSSTELSRTEQQKLARLERSLAKTSEQILQQETELAKIQTKVRKQEQELSDRDAEIESLRRELAKQKNQNESQRQYRLDKATEAETRKYLIDGALAEVGWHFGENMEAEVPVQGMPINARSPEGKGYCDYVLYDAAHEPLAVVEAKRTSVSVENGSAQAKLYADCLEKACGRRPIILLSNGYDFCYLDDRSGYPRRRVSGFFTPEELRRRIHQRERQSLAKVNPRAGIADRPYQLHAIQSVAEAADKKRRKFLLVQATGTGKTRVSAAISDLMLRSDWAYRILFLADRNPLVQQGKSSYTDILGKTYPLCNLVLANKDKKSAMAENPENSRIIFSTYPTMLNSIDSRRKEDGSRLFTPGYFDLIILDESHRSIYNKYQDIFSYFDAMLLGLTATPKSDMDHDTYGFFDLPKGEPTDNYDYRDAVEQGYLVDYEAMDCSTRLMKEGLKYNELSPEDRAEYERTFGDDETDGVGSHKKDIRPEVFNKTVFNAPTIDKVLKRLMADGIYVEDGDKLGKTIIFAKNHTHAEAIVERFHALYPEYGDAFIQTIDYRIPYADDLILEFGTPEKMPQIAVSVDKLDTGIDIPPVVNLVFFKVMQSYSKFWQMIGRGTRKCKDLLGKGKDKEAFRIFDWGGNFTFFSMPEHRGSEPGAIPSISSRVFALKADVVSLLYASGKVKKVLEQNATDGAKWAVAEPHDRYDIESAEPDEQNVYQNFVYDLYQGVSGLNSESYRVKMRQRVVSKYRNIAVLASLDKEEATEVGREVAPLIGNAEQDALVTRRFDHLMLAVMLDSLTQRNDSLHVASVIKTAGKLRSPRYQNIPEVRAAKACIDRVMDQSFWEHITLGRIEAVRRKLRDIVKYIEVEEQPIYYTCFSDEELEVKPAFHTEPVVVSESYQEKAESYLWEHKDQLAIHKLYTNMKLTAMELKELERILWQELGTEDDYRKVYHDLPVQKMVRKIVGVDMQTVECMFSKFLQSNRLNTKQMDFLRTIINYIVKNGYIDNMQETLGREPFNQFGDVIDLFGSSQDGENYIRMIMATVREITNNAMDIA